MSIESMLNAISSAIGTVASMQQKRDKVDTSQESDTLKAMLSGINHSSEVTGMDTVEFKKLVDSEKNVLNSTPFIDDAEILAGLMGALAESDPKINMEKIEKYNKEHPVLEGENVADTIMSPDENGYIGMDVESFNTIEKALGADAGKVFQYMSSAIKDGSAGRIAEANVKDEEEFGTQENIDTANVLRQDAAFTKYEYQKRMNAATQKLNEDIKSMTPKFI